MKNSCIIWIIFFSLHSCTNESSQNSPPAVNNEKVTDSFFPVTSFIKGQIITLDSLPVTPLQLTIIKNKRDSAWISKKEIKPMLMTFLTPDINETNLTRYFKETRFNDQTINAVTFTYDPIVIIPDSISLRHWDVYIHPQTGSVIKVYMVKEIKENNKTFTQQLTWQSNKLAKITTILNKPDGNLELLKEVIFIWDFN